MAFNPAGVAAHPSPRTLDIMLIEMYSLAGLSLGMFGNKKETNGAIPFVILSINPLFFATSISPVHSPITPHIVIQSVIASFAESRAPFVTASILPVNTA